MFKECPEDEALEILRDPSVLPMLKFYPEGIRNVEKYLVGGALLIVMPDGPDVEVHMACRYRDRAALRQSLQDAAAWLRSRGFRQIWTTIPENRQALRKMIEKLGFKQDSGRWVWA